MAPGEGVETQPNQLCCGEGGKERPAAARPCAGRDLGDTAAPGSRRSLKTRGARRQSWCSLLFDSCKAPVVRQRNHQSKRERWIPPPISQGTICTLFSFSKHSGFTDRSGFIVYTSGWRNWVHMSLSFLMLKKTHTIYFWRSGKTSKFHLCCTPTAAILFDGEHVLLKIQPDTQNVTSLRPDYKWTQQMGQTVLNLQGHNSSHCCTGLKSYDFPESAESLASTLLQVISPSPGSPGHTGVTPPSQKDTTATLVWQMPVYRHTHFIKPLSVSKRNGHNCIFSTKLLAHAKILTCDSTSATLVAYCS